ncbi:MAG: hypothetical protein KC591_15080, partial [Gemmatimonadetes bacterium]|nr:hypothetical protein [Gemmatimonadota bacterium]
MRPSRLPAFVLIALAATFVAQSQAHAQGCVAVRPMSCATSEHVSGSSSSLPKGHWQASSSYQHFRSFRHFRGDHEEANRVEDG